MLKYLQVVSLIFFFGISHLPLSACPYCGQQSNQRQNYYMQNRSQQYYPNYQQQNIYQYSSYWPQGLPRKAIEIRGTNVQGNPINFYGKFGNSLGDYDDF